MGTTWHPRDCTGWCATDTLGKGSEASCVIVLQDISVPAQIGVPGGMLICSWNPIVSLLYPAFQSYIYSRILHAPLTMDPCAVWPDSKVMSFIMYCYGEYLRSQKHLAIFSYLVCPGKRKVLSEDTLHISSCSLLHQGSHGEDRVPNKKQVIKSSLHSFSSSLLWA